jgi:hypothetical protein
MVDKSRMTLQKLARWHPNQSHPAQDRKGSTALWEGTLQPLDHEDLKQGALYIIKIHHVSVGLFQGKRLTTTNCYRKGLTLIPFHS